MTALLVIGVALLLFLGAPIFAIMIAYTALGDSTLPREFFEEFAGPIGNFAKTGTGEEASILATIPLFIFMGFVMAEARTADRLVRAAQSALGWLPGGLAIVTIFACALFTTFTGASGVTIVALGSLVMPSLLKERYPERFSLGLVAGTGSVGLLFPPALPLFVFGTVYGAAERLTRANSGGQLISSDAFSTERFALAGVVPGMVLLGVLSLYAIIVAVRNKVPRHRFDPRALARHTAVAFPEILIPFLIIGGLVKGGLQIPEVAALGLVYVLVLEVLVYRDIRIRDLWKVTVESMALVGAIFIIILCASALTNYFVTAQIPQLLIEWVKDNVSSKWAFLLSLNVVLLVVGMMMEIFSAIVVVVPLITPLAIEYGIDPYHLGVIFLLNLELGYITPPVGLNLFITSFKFRRPIVDVTRSTIPFLVLMLIALVLVTYIPALTIYPEAERRGRVTAISIPVADAYRKLGSVSEIELPNGQTKKLADCETLEDSLERLDCEGLFAAVTDCRNKGDAECERDTLQEYVELNEDEDDVDLDGIDGLDEDDEDDEEELE